jgi:predicted transcriptional regulator
VKNGDAIRGVISERDIVQAVSRHGNAAPSFAVLNIVSQAMIRVEPDDSLKRAMRLMTNNHVRHLLVIDDGKLVGIVSNGDIVKQRLEDLETETNVLRDAYLAVR